MQIVTYSNPLNPLTTETKTIEANTLVDIVKDFQFDDVAYELVVIKNNQIVNDLDIEIIEEDIVGLMLVPKGGGGGGKNIARSIALIAVAVTAPMLFAEGMALTGAAITSPMMYYTGMALTAAAGSMLVNAVLPPQTPDMGNLSGINNLQSSTTYGWNVATNQSTQGIALPKIYGKHKVTPPLICKYIETVDNNQYFHGLYSLNDGEISDVTNIMINGQDIANYDNVTYQIVNGTNDNPLVADFNDTRYDVPVNRKLDTDYTIVTTTGDSVTTLNIGLVFPRGIWHVKDDGTFEDYSVKVVVEYFNGTDWVFVGDRTEINTYSSYWMYKGTFGRTGGQAGYYQYSAINGTFLNNIVSSLPSGAVYIQNSGLNKWYGVPESYTINYTTITSNSTSTLRKTFNIPNLTKAQYQVRAKLYEAPESGSRYGSDCYFEYLEETISDDFIYPNTALLAIKALATDQLSGSAPTVTCEVESSILADPTPAQVCKQMLLDAGVPETRLNLDKFDAWHTWCLTNSIKCNVVCDSTLGLKRWYDTISTLGYASIIRFGSKFSPIIDKADEIPTQGFTAGMGNIIKDSYRETYLPLKDRANILEVTYYEPSNGYERTVFEVSNEQYNTSTEINKQSINLIGCTSRQQAWDYAKRLLNYNRYLTISVDFEADADTLYCNYGDVIKVSHDLPSPEFGYSGRIVSCTTTYVELDRVIESTGGTYAIQVRRNSNNEISEHNVLGFTNTNVLYFTEPLSTPFEPLDNYAVGQLGKVSKLFRIVRITTKSDSTRQISALEYNPSVYDVSGMVSVPSISNQVISNLNINDYIKHGVDGTIKTVIQLRWTGASLKYQVFVKVGTTGTYVKIADTTDNYYDYETDGQYDGKALYFKVTAGTQKKETLYTVAGKTTPPPAVENLTASENGNLFQLTWDYPYKPIDFKEFIVSLGSTEIGRTTTTAFEYYSAGLGTKYFKVKAIDTTSHLSSIQTVSISASAPDPVTAITYYTDNHNYYISWEYNEPTDFKEFVIKSNSNKLLYRGQDANATIPIVSKTGYTISLSVYDTAGNYSTPTKTVIIPTTISDIGDVSQWYDGNRKALKWNEVVVNNIGPIGYEIREGNTTWDKTQFVAQQYETTFKPTTDGFYQIKAFLKNNQNVVFYSTNATSVLLEGASLTANILQTWDERGTSWSGTWNNIQLEDIGSYTNCLTTVGLTFIDSIASIDEVNDFDTLDSSVSYASYEIPTAHIVTLTTAQQCSISCKMISGGQLLSDTVDDWLNIDLVSDIDGAISGQFKTVPMIAISQDGVTYDSYQEFYNGNYIGKAFKFRIDMYSYQTDIRPYLADFIFTIDMPDRVDKGTNVSISAGGTNITYSPAMHTKPNTQVTIVNATVGDDVILTNESATGFTVQVKNGGTGVARTINWLSQGY